AAVRGVSYEWKLIMDRIVFSLISLGSILFVLVFGDSLFFGVWYYFAIPVVAFLLAMPFKPKQYFLSAISIVILLTYIPYWNYNFSAKQPDGLLGLGHMFSLPGLAAGIILAGAHLMPKVKTSGYVFIVSFLFSLCGFLANQII